MRNTPSYHRTYTALPGLQAARQVHYTLLSKRVGNQLCFGIRVCEHIDGRDDRAESCLFTRSRVQAEALLTYLYENAVPAAHCASVISDGYAALKWEEHHGSCSDSAAHCG